MIPNKHLETPHYKLERLRHDDPRLDDQKASYVMAEEAARELETDTTVSRKDADVKVRPEAAVKGITPTQPAPMSQPRPARTEKVQTESSGGLFGFIKKMFSSSPVAEEKPAPSNARGRNQGRNGNGGDRNRGRNRRGERNGERAERPAANAAEGTAEGTPNNRNGNRNNRNGNRSQNGPKPERQANPAAVTPVTEAAPGSEAPASADGEERRGRGRNRRGRGRGKNERDDRGERTEGDVSNAVAVSASPFSGPPVGMAGASASMPIQNLANSFGNAKPAAARQERAERAPRAPRPSNRPAQGAPNTPTALPVAAVTAVSSIEVIAKPAPELPKVAFKALEEIPLHSVVQSAGMVWVATDASKHAEAQSQIQPEPTNLGRAPKPAATLPEGPMVLVETGGQQKTV
jgi:ribonuclease E